MHLTVILKVIGFLLLAYSITMVPPALVSLYYSDQSHTPFFIAFGITVFTGFLCWLSSFKQKMEELRIRDGFIIVVMFWTVLGLFGSIPLLLANAPDMTFTDAVFESISGLTTTGATVITELDNLPKSILYYRQQLQWLGGIGIIVLAMALFPILGIGGMQLYRAETPGPVKDNKLTPRLEQSAKALISIYIFLTVICASSYWAAGMSLFDSICHAFSTVSIGGFSTHDASIGFFDSPLIEGITSVFMLIASLNFALHFTTWNNKSLRHYWKDPELKFFLGLMCCFVMVSFVYLYLTGTYSNPLEAFRYGSFEAISIATTTGYGTADFSSWPSMVPILLIMGSFMGACAGSTGGGIKVIRVLLLLKQGAREIQRLIHPNAIFVIRLGRKSVDDKIIETVSGFIGIYITAFVLLLLAMLTTGMDLVTAFSAVAASINNLGPGLGDVSAHYADITPAAKWIMCFSMLLGRLELLTLLVLFNPLFWRR